MVTPSTADFTREEKDEDEEDAKKSDLNPALEDKEGDKPKEEKEKGVV